MQTVTETLPRRLRDKLETAEDNPPEIIWQADERLVVPKAEVFFGGRVYQPQRSEKDKKGGIKIIGAESFTAVIDQELKDLWASGKISLPMPFLDRGYTREGRIPAYRPWPNSGFDSGGSDLQDKGWLRIADGCRADEQVPRLLRSLHRRQARGAEIQAVR
jgi:hypothetical protein